jgi:metal-responsive CopG/Arc/MetJ family transcriptional regulator
MTATSRDRTMLVTVRLPEEVIEKIEEARRRKGLVTRSETIRLAIKESLDRWLKEKE